MNKSILTILIFLTCLISLRGQMISTDPAVPTMGTAIRIYFDATHINAGALRNYTGDLYAHTGVTIAGVNWQKVIGTWGNNTVQPKLTYLGSSRYELNITPDIKTFYSLATTDIATKICLVIRNADGSKQTAPDIFIDVFAAGLNAKFALPERYSLVAELNDDISINVAASAADSISLFINGIWKKHGRSPSLLTDTITADQYGEFRVKAIAWDYPLSASDSFFVYVREPLVTEAIPSGMQDGINYTGNNSVTLVVHAPFKNHVFAVGDFTGWIAGAAGYMKRTPDTERYWIEIGGLEEGKEYRFQYLVDSIYIADPYADKVLDPWNDQYITAETYPDLISYPKDTASGIVSVLQTSQSPYVWDIAAFEPPVKSELIIYELLIRDFIAKHDFKTLIDSLHYLDDLGINAIELMPVNEFEGNISWGYNPSFYFAPDKYYGPKDDMKAFIDSCHARGIAVIMDLVLNHCNGQSPFVQLYLDYYGSDQIFMQTPNPWFNASSPNPIYKFGADFNHESLNTQNLVDRVTKYWLTEYKIDGFRFDFTKGFTNTTGEGTPYDLSRINILKRMAYQVWSVNPDAYVILEHFAANDEEIELSNYGMLIWGNNNYSYSEAAMGYASDLTSASYPGRNWTEPSLVSYMESHDEERLMFKTLTFGSASGNYNTRDLQTALKRMELDALFFLTVPGPKMIWQFGELGYDISIDQNGRTGEKPIKWNYFSDVNRQKLFRFYKVLNILKATQPVFQSGVSYTWSLSSFSKRMQLISDDNKAVIMGNFGITGVNINPAFPVAGKWYEYFSGDSVVISNINDPIPFNPGEYRLYTTKRMPSYKILLDVEDHEALSENFISAYPNPSKEEFNFIIKNNVPDHAVLTIFDLSGRVIRHIETYFNDPSIPVRWDGKSASGVAVPAGMYIVHIQCGSRSGMIKIIKN